MTSRQRPGQQGLQSQKPTVPLAEMLHEGGQTDKQHSEAIVPLLSTQHSGTLTSQASSPQTAWWWRNGARVWGVCEPATAHVSGFSTHFPLVSAVRYTQHTSNKCAHTCCLHTCPCNSVVNKKLQCSRQHLLHSDATHRKHVLHRLSLLITPQEQGFNYLFLVCFILSERNMD